MNCLVWKVQGIGNPWTSNALYSHVKQFSIDFVFLIETKLLGSQVATLARTLSFIRFFVVDRAGLSGGLALLWNDQITIRSASRFHIDTIISCQNILP